MEMMKENKSSGNYEFKWTGFGKYKMLLGRGYEGAREEPEEERGIRLRVYTWEKLTPLTEVDIMRKGLWGLIGYTPF